MTLTYSTQRRHPELLNRIREEKNIKARGINNPLGKTAKTEPAIVQLDELCNAGTFDGSAAETKPSLELVYVSGISNAETKYIDKYTTTTSTPTSSDPKSPYAAQITVHVKKTPVVDTNNTSRQQKNLSTNSANIIQTTPEQPSSASQITTPIGPSFNNSDHCENVEYLAVAGQPTIGHNNATVVESVHKDGCISHSRIEKRRLVSTVNTVVVPPIKRARDEFTIISDQATLAEADHTYDADAGGDADEDDETDLDVAGGHIQVTIDNPLYASHHRHIESDPIECDVNQDEDQCGSEQYFNASDSRYPSVNRELDNHKEILALRKQLMVREFEMVQQKHRLEMEQLEQKHSLEMELRQRDLDYKREQHHKTMQCLNKRLLEK